MKHNLRIYITFIIIVITVATGTIALRSNTNVLTIYSTKKEDSLKDTLQAFTSKTNIKINIIYDTANNLLNKIEKDGHRSVADVFISSDGLEITLAKNKGFLQKIKSETLNLPNKEDNNNDYWIPLSKSAWVIAYNKENVNPSQIQNYEDLSDVKWNKKIILSESSHNNSHSLLAAFIIHSGTEYTKVWLNGIISNMIKKHPVNEIEQIKSLANGDGSIAIINSSVLAKIFQQNKNIQEKIGVIFPNQSNYGTHANISGIGILKNAKNKNGATLLIQHLLSEEGQYLYAVKNNEYPIHSNVKLPKPLSEWGIFKEDKLTTSESLVYYAKDAIKMAEITGWNK